MDEFHHEMEELQDGIFHPEFMKIFETLSFKEKVQRVMFGLKQDKETGAYKWAKLQMFRLLSPLAAIVVPVLVLVVLAVFAGMTPTPSRAVVVEIIEPEPLDELDEPEEIPDDPLEPPEPMDFEFLTDMNLPDTPTPSPPTDFSPQPVEFDSVAIIKSPVIMKGIYGSRSPGSRGAALARHGGNNATEGAVLRALRWLKKHQNEDGSWDETKPAMTSLGLLTFLAHGELPGASPEFGVTVEKAIKWLVENQTGDGHFKGRDGHDYSQPICAYALCEAYGLTKVPMLKEAAEKAIMVVIKGQNPSGGFNYNLKPTTRDDTSYMGWCAQALKAAYMAGLDAPGLQDCIKKSIAGFKKNYAENAEIGGFGYTSGSTSHGMTGVGALCLKLLGDGKSSEVRKAMYNLQQAVFKWEKGGKFNKLYYSYYITQAKFHEGGETWKTWNRMFAPVLVQNQTIEKAAIADPNGKMVDIGHWAPEKEVSGHTDAEGRVMNTCLCALQLQVYYRYLPTFKPPEDMEMEEVVEDEDDLDIDIVI